MNKIYKLIWSKTKNCWVVASELAKGHGNNKSRVKNSLLAVFVMTALLAGGVADVQALTQQEKEEIKNEVALDLLDKIAHGGEIPGAKAEYGPTNFPDAIANRIFYYNDVSSKIGEKLKKDGLTLRYFAVRPDYIEPSRDYLERYAKSDWTNVNNDGAFGAHSMALGYRAFAEAKHGVAIGRSALAGGSKDKDGYHGDGGVAIGNHAWALGDKSVSVGNDARAVHKGIAIGIQAEAGLDEDDNTTDWSTAPGFTPKSGKSIQYDPKTKLPYVTSDITQKFGAIAIGTDAKAHGRHSTAIGTGAKAKAHYASSFGFGSEASAMDSVAFGNNATAKGLGAIAIGSDHESSSGGAQAYSGDTIAIGRSAMAGNENDTATVYNTVAIGREARAYGKNSIALGGTANVGDVWQKQLAEGGTAIGSSANAALENATALGYKSIAYAKDAVTLGANTRADIDGGVALGSESNVGSYSSPSYGKAGKVGYDPLGAGADETSTWKATKAAVSVGNQQKDITRQIINVAAGTDNTDAVNVAQLKALQSKAWKDLVASENKLGARIATNTTSITNLSGRVRTNEGDIGRLKTDVSTNDSRIRYLYNNMPFLHYVSVKSEGMAPNEGNYKNDGASKRGAIAIGAHTSSDGDGAVALGAHSFVRGQGSVIVGENSDNYTGGLKAKEGQFDQSIILGSDNTIFAQSAENGGREDKVIGNMNRVEESHGTFVRGTGNFVYDAYNNEALTDEDKQKEQDFLDPIDGGDPTGLFQKGRSHVSVEGDGNLVSGALYTQVSGVGNEISNSQPDENGPSTPRVTYNIVTGNRNTVVDSSHNLILGDNHELENVNGNIIIGSLTTKAKTEKSNVTILGNDANVSEDGGVALGTGSVASTAAGIAGYDPLTGEASAKTTSTWKSGNGAISVGTSDKTRQITNLAAGIQDTDAVNVAQLKALNTKVDNLPSIHYFSVKADDSKKPADTNWNNDGATGNKAIAIGQKAKSEGYAAVAMGASAHTGANAHYSLALGMKSDAAGFANIALGNEAKAQAAMYATAIGQEAAVTKNQGIAIGTTAKTDAENGISFGTQAKSLANRGIAVGTNSTVDETGGRGIAIGDGAYVGAKTQGHLGTGMSNPGDAWNPSEPYLPVADDTVAGPGKLARENSMAIGMKASAFGFQTTALGAGAEAHDTNTTAVGAAAVAKGNYSTALGKQARTFEKESTSVGHWADSRAEFATALGANTIVYKKGGVALGFGARAYDENSVAIGSNSFAKEAIDGKAYLSDEEVKAAAGIVSVGNPAYKVGDKDVAANYRRIVNVAGGIHDNDAVNVLQLKAARTTVKAGDYVTVTEGKEQNVDGTVYTVKGPTLSVDGGNLTVADDEETITGTTDKRKIGYKLSLNKELTGLTSVSSTTFKAGDNVTLGGTGLTITNGPSVTATGIDAGSKKITNVAAGTEDGDAVNFKQLSDVKTIATTNQTNITKLQNGFTVKDGGTGSANVTLGGDTKQEVTFKAAVDKTTEATENGSSLTSTVGTDRNVTYKLNMNQLKKDLGITEGPGGVMSSWKLKVKGETTPQDIKNGNEVTFDASGDGITVTRENSTIKYSINGSKLDITNNQSITKLGDRIDKLPSIHYFSVNSEDSANPAGTNWSNDGATGTDAVAIGKNAAASGKSAFATGWKSKAAGYSDIAIGREAEATGGWGVAIGQAAKAQASTAVAMAYGANAKGSNSLAIGVQSEAKTDDSSAYGRGAKALGEVALAVGTLTKAEGNHSSVFGYKATTDSTAWNGTAIGRGAYIGKQAADGTTPDTGVSNNYYTPVDDDTVVEAGKETKNSTAVGFGAKSFGYQNTAVGAGAEAFDTNTVAVGVLSKAIGHYANALGKQARAEGKNSTAIGHFARALGESSMALGDYAITSTLDGTGKVNQSVALGSHARVAADNSLALGNNSLANIADDVKTEAYLSKEAFKKENGVVSVGNSEYTIGDEKIKQNYRRITNVAGGAEDNDAVNVAQLKALEGKVTTNKEDITTIKKGWTLKDANTGTKTVKAEDTVKVTGDDYITATVDNDGLKLGMSETKLNDQINKQINTNSTVTGKMNSWVLKAASDKDAEKAGKTINNTDNDVTFDVETGQGLTVARNGATIKYGVNNTQLVKNINDGDTAVTNISAKFSISGADATTKKDLTLSKTSTPNIQFLGTAGETTVTVGGNDTAPTVTVGLDAKFKKQVTDNTTNIGKNTEAIGKNTENIDKNTKAIAAKMTSWKLKAGGVDGEAEIKDGNEVTFDVAVKDKGLTVTRDGSTIKYGIDGKQIDISQNETVTDLKTEIKNSKTTVEAGDYVTVTKKTEDGKGTTYTVNGPKLTVVDGEKNLTVTDDTDKDGKKVGYKLELNKELTGLTSVSSDTFKAGNDVTLDKTGLKITGGPSVTTGGINAGKKKITNVADGDVSENSTDAVNGGQLYKLQQTVAGSKVTVEAAENSQITVTSETQADKSTKYVVDIAKDGTIGGDKDENLVTGKTVKDYVDANQVTVTDDGKSGVKVEKIVEDGKPVNYKVSLGDKIKAGDVTVDGTKGKGQITGLSNTTWDADKYVSGRAATEDQLKAVSQNAAEAAKKHTTVVAGDYVTVSEGTNANGGKEYTVTGPKVEAAQGETNLVVGDIMDGNKKVGYNLKLNKELTGLTRVSSATFKAGNDVTINNDGLTIKDGPSVKKDGIDAGGKVIANVADGKADTDAVNVRQLNAIANAGNQNLAILGGKVSELDGRVNRVGAGAAALAALHPLDFDPDDKWDFAAGYGNYSGANAVAIGAYYRPNEDTMFSVGGSFGGGENMVNAGVSVKLGQGNNVTTSKIAMAKEIKDLRSEVEVLRQAIVGVGQGQELDPMKMKLFPDIEKNHWAYEAVEELTKQGLLEGYPDGTFRGDRMMTRYEFAQLVYRAMQKGLNVNEKLIQEFEPELERFRIDVISKDKNGNPVIERVRVNEKRKAK